MKSVCTNEGHCAWVFTAPGEKARGSSKITCAIPFVNVQSMLCRLLHSLAHIYFSSVFFISEPGCVPHSYSLCRSSFVLSIRPHAHAYIHTHRGFFHGTIALLGWRSQDKTTDLISWLPLLTQSSSVITAPIHADHQPLSNRPVCLDLALFVLLFYVLCCVIMSYGFVFPGTCNALILCNKG